jgi:alpha-galactosidase
MTGSFNGELVYRRGGKTAKVRFSESGISGEASVRSSMQGARLVVGAVIPSDAVFVSAFIECAQDYSGGSRIFANGYQSWTDSREFRAGERTPSLSLPAKLLNGKYAFESYGDYTFVAPAARGEVVSHSYTYIRRENTLQFFGSCAEDRGFTIFRHRSRKGRMRIERDCEGMKGGDAILFDIFSAKGKDADVHRQYFDALNIPEKEVRKVSGWTSWYNYYQNISQEIILKNVENYRSRSLAIDIFQIDDGYQRAVGDWLDIRTDRFPGGMKLLADRIHSSGFKAGLWLAPFSCEKDSQLFKTHPEWIVRDGKGRALKAGSNWSSFYALDIYNEEVRDYLRKVFDTVTREWGFDLVKLDFLYCVCMIPRHGKSRGEIMADAVKLLRECLPSTEILGCGVPLASVFGKFEYCRIGCDLNLSWNDGYMKFFHRERVSTINAIGNTISRRSLDQRAFLNDPDVVILRDGNNALSADEKESVLAVNTLFGSVFFTSDDISAYSDLTMCLYRDALEQFRSPREISRAAESGGVHEINFKDGPSSYLRLLNMNDSSVVYTPAEGVNVLRQENGGFVQGGIQLKAHQSAVFEILPIQQEEI